MFCSNEIQDPHQTAAGPEHLADGHGALRIGPAIKFVRCKIPSSSVAIIQEYGVTEEVWKNRDTVSLDDLLEAHLTIIGAQRRLYLVVRRCRPRFSSAGR